MCNMLAPALDDGKRWNSLKAMKQTIAVVEQHDEHRNSHIRPLLLEQRSPLQPLSVSFIPLLERIRFRHG